VSTFFKWGGQQAAAPTPASSPQGAMGARDVIAASKVLPRFLAAVERQPAPVLLDLGPVVGANVELFGERLACKLFVQDLYQELDRPIDVEAGESVIAALRARLPDKPESVDGILCWDLFDYLDTNTSKALAADLARLLKPGGVLHGFFAVTATETDCFTRFVVEADDRLRHRTYPARRRRRNVLSPRDSDRMFTGLRLTEHVLLKTGSRETLFRKS
jgi:hypothetical protein